MQELILRNDADPAEVGRKIRKRRKELGISQDGLADRLGSDRNAVYKHEHGLQEMSICALFRYAEALQTDVQALVPDRLTAGKATDYQARMNMLFMQLSDESRKLLLQMAEHAVKLEMKAAG